MSCIAAIVSYPLTHFVASLAQRWGFVDRPDGHHKSHKLPVALGGGLAVFLAAVVTFAVEYFSSQNLQESLHDNAPFLSGLLLAGGWIVILGLVDDRYGMKGRYKLVGQIFAALIVIASGLEIQAFSLFGQKIQLGWLSIPFTLFWLVGAINSLNLLDGIDGLATTIGIILCSAITVMALWFGQPAVAVVAAVFAGALLGFLRFNFPPATVYLGDAGSMLIGLVVGSLAIGASLKGPATVAMAAPLAIWSLPMFDSFVAILRRKLTGRSIYATDRGHLHHRLMARFGKNTRVLGVVAICCAVTCGGALLSMFMQNDLLAIGSVMLVICILVATQIFGHVEFMMLANRMKSVGMSFIKPSNGSGSWQSSVRLQGTREWDMLWQSLIEYAEKSRLIEVRIDLNLASIQEAYHASWKRRSSSERREQWRTEVPLFMDNHVVGRITLCGERDVNSLACDTVGRVMETLAMLEGEIAALATKAAHELKDATASQKPTEGGKRAESTVAPIDAETTPKAVASP
jgi:UDP-GlcNAc:undecaprenyl-phosphate GlcNAc-1-phosphate transferase